MAKISITREHNLDRNAARAEVDKLADKLARELSAKYHWEGDKLLFKRSGADGFIKLDDHKLHLEIKLGLMLTPLKGKIESTVSDYLDQNLA